jgi:CHAD domain-containing protein
VAEHLDGAPLVPVVVLHTRRREQELLGPDGTVVALTCTDDVRAEVGGRVESWREAEVELSGGGMTLLDAVEAQLSAAGIHRALIGSKAGRALAARADRQAPGSASTAADLVLSYLAVQVGVLQRFGTGLDSDSEAVHDARVATRRLRSTLRTYADLFEGSSLGKVNSRLRALTRVLGPARDSEVVLARLTTALVDLLGVAADSALARLAVDPLEARREELRKQLKDYVASPAHAGLQKALMALLVVPRLRPVASGPAVEVLPGGRSAMVAAVLRTSDGASVGATSLATWHEIRKEAKVVRYATELLLPAIPALAAQKAAWELVTESLGAAQDIVVASRTLSELALRAAADGGAGDVLDDLRHRLEERLPAALAQGRDALATALAGE